MSLVDEELVKTVLQSFGHNNVTQEDMEAVMRMAAARTEEFEGQAPRTSGGEDEDEDDDFEEDEDEDEDDADASGGNTQQPVQSGDDGYEDEDGDNDVEGEDDEQEVYEEGDETMEGADEDQYIDGGEDDAAALLRAYYEQQGEDVERHNPRPVTSRGASHKAVHQYAAHPIGTQHNQSRDSQHLQRFQPYDDLVRNIKNPNTSMGNVSGRPASRQHNNTSSSQRHLPLHLRGTTSSNNKQNNTTASSHHDKENTGAPFPILSKAERQQLKHELLLKTGRRGRMDTPLVLARRQILPVKRYADPVSLGAKVRQQWSSDNFLAQKGRSEERWKVRMSMLQ